MTITLPVINFTVDEIVLDYLVKIQHGDQIPTNDSSDYNRNYNNSTRLDENNNQTQNEFDDVLNWADEPWTECADVEIPDWARIEGPTFGETKCDASFIWAEDPWVQIPLVGIPEWMVLPGIDDVQATDSNGDDKNDCDAWPEDITPATVNDEDDEAFLASFVDVGNWCDEPFYQLPLDVPRWALLPGIDFPVRHRNARHRNSLYWKCYMERYIDNRRSFGRMVFNRVLPTLLEEREVYNNDGKSMLCVPVIFKRRYRF